MLALEKREKKGEKLGECEAALKRRTDRPIMTIEMIKNMAKDYSNENKTRIRNLDSAR